ncbi:MAG: SUF system NifU family Fe-S cluster assembly protein [Candidatus Omnitrophica bacterium]|nr:SUF system NifU family Fe-S cluster assembly protein [Candidatus Omnitrophota bacterium]
MSDLRELYQQVILDHSRKPHNYHGMDNANRQAEGHNPLCGDHLKLYLLVEDGVVRDVSFEGAGCAIFKASASMMTDSVKGKRVAEVEALFEKFHEMLSRDIGKPFNSAPLGKLAVFSGVCEFPVRVKCATLAWHTLHSAIEGKQDSVTTE